MLCNDDGLPNKEKFFETWRTIYENLGLNKNTEFMEDLLEYTWRLAKASDNHSQDTGSLTNATVIVGMSCVVLATQYSGNSKLAQELGALVQQSLQPTIQAINEHYPECSHTTD